MTEDTIQVSDDLLNFFLSLDTFDTTSNNLPPILPREDGYLPPNYFQVAEESSPTNSPQPSPPYVELSSPLSELPQSSPLSEPPQPSPYSEHFSSPLTIETPQSPILQLGEPVFFSAGVPATKELPQLCTPLQTSKKRRRNQKSDQVNSEVLLPRDALLKLTSEEMENYVQRLKATRVLSTEEEKELKRQRRLIKNREYAKQSRKKKKTQLKDLEGQISKLTAQNEELRTQNSSLQSEIVLLNSKLLAVTSENTRLRGTLSQLKAYHRKAQGEPAWPSLTQNKTVAGVCLLGVVFFALFFHIAIPWRGEPSATNDLSFSRTARVLLQDDTSSHVPPPSKNSVVPSSVSRLDGQDTPPPVSTQSSGVVCSGDTCPSPQAPSCSCPCASESIVPNNSTTVIPIPA
jgi:hypothetical protein